MKARGFTLAECMASLLILTLALFAVMSVNAMTLRQTAYNEDAQTANTIACSQMAIAESILKVNFRANSGDINTGTMQSVTFPKFTYQIVDGGFLDSQKKLRAIAVAVYWTDKGTNRNFQLDTVFYDY